MARQGQSFYIDSYGPEDNALMAGVQWLYREAKSTGKPALIAVSTKRILENTSWSKFSDLFLALKKNERVSFDGVSFSSMTLRKKKSSWDGPVLVIYGGQKLLDAVDSLYGSCDVLYVPWARVEADAWISTWGAKELGKVPDEDNAPVEESLNEIVRIALDRLTRLVNLSSGIHHPSDHDQAIRTFETLVHKEQALDAELVRQYLVRNNWQPRHAQDVKELAQKFLDGRRPRGAHGCADEWLWNFLQEEIKIVEEADSDE